MIKRDFQFSEDGDLLLGSPKTNEDGELLYIDMFGNVSTDSTSGPLIRDIPLFSHTNAIKQVMRNRLLTDAPDWYHHPEMGGNLSDLVGEPNTRATGEKGAELITQALTYDNYLLPEQINVRAVPVNAQTILFYVELKRDTEIQLTYPVLFNLEHGIMSEYEVKE